MFTVKYYANLRDVTGLKEDKIDLKDTTVHNLINFLVSKYGQAFSGLMFDGDSLRNNIIILVNGINIIFKNGINETIKEGDTVDIFPPVAGG